MLSNFPSKFIIIIKNLISFLADSTSILSYLSLVLMFTLSLQVWVLFCLFLGFFCPFMYFIIFYSRLDMLYRMINTEVNSFMLAVEHIFPSVWGCVNLVRFGLHLKFALLWLLSVYQSLQISPVIFYFCFSA